MVMLRLPVVASVLALSGGATSWAQPVPAEDSLLLKMPTAMVAGKSLTLRADILDPHGEIDWDLWSETGTVTATRVSDGSAVPTSITIFETHLGVPPPDSILFYNGVGSVTITLDQGAATPAGDIQVTVSVGPLSASKVVSVLNNPPELVLSGALSGDNLDWNPAKGVIHIVGDCSVTPSRVLRIAPGTLVMWDAGPPNDGTLITVFGHVEAMGTADEPIFFFPTDGASGLHLNVGCVDPVYNIHSYRGILQYGSQRSTYSNCIVTGGGNGPVAGHTRPPVLHFGQSSGADFDDCVFVDCNGKAIYGTPSGNPLFNIRNCLFSRLGHGVEFTETGDYTLNVERSYFTGIGHGSASCDRKGDALNIRGDTYLAGGPKRVTGCMFTDMRDDCIDEKASLLFVENCIMYNNQDCAITMEAGADGRLTASNMLVFDCGRGFSGRQTHAELTNCTIIGLAANPRTFLHPGCDASILHKNVFDRGIVDCCGDVAFCVINRDDPNNCGPTNIYGPTGLDPVAKHLVLEPPLRDSGPNGEMIGWLGWFMNPPTVPTGACCFADGSCAESTQADCTGTGGAYQGDGSACTAADCPQPTGACCLPDGSCSASTAAGCAAASGSFQGNGVNCASVTCPQPTGACCHTDGSCTIDTEIGCIAAIGVYQGDSSTCASSNCPQPTGACCAANGSCTDLGPADCLAAGGLFQGVGTFCATASCPQPFGACCGPDGNCVEVPEEDCLAFGGVFQGTGSTCNAVSCPQPTGACCIVDGSCTAVTEADCAAAGGLFQGIGVTCGAAQCPILLGSCCFGDGSCAQVLESDCAVLGGSFLGVDTECGSPECPQPHGACCISDGSCISSSHPECDGLGGLYQGDGVDCGSASCTQPCPCDWNQVDGLDSQDFFDFLDSFFFGDADFNGADGTDSQDLFDFYDCFFTGC